MVHPQSALTSRLGVRVRPRRIRQRDRPVLPTRTSTFLHSSRSNHDQLTVSGKSSNGAISSPTSSVPRSSSTSPTSCISARANGNSSARCTSLSTRIRPTTIVTLKADNTPSMAVDQKQPMRRVQDQIAICGRAAMSGRRAARRERVRMNAIERRRCLSWETMRMRAGESSLRNRGVWSSICTSCHTDTTMVELHVCFLVEQGAQKSSPSSSVITMRSPRSLSSSLPTTRSIEFKALIAMPAYDLPVEGTKLRVDV